MKEWIYRCPECGKAKDPYYVIGSRNYSMRRWELPYFMCGECRLIYVDKSLIRKIVRELFNEIKGQKPASYKEVCKEMFECLDNVTKYYCISAGYKSATFKKELA